MKQLEHQTLAKICERGVIAVAFVAQERVRPVDFHPLKINAGFIQSGSDAVTAFQRHVRVLPAPNMQQFAFYFTCPLQRIVALAFAEGSGMDIGRVETNSRQNAGVHSGAKRQVATHANAGHA